MALRLVDVTLPAEGLATLRELVDPLAVAHVRTWCDDDGSGRACLLTDAEDVEEVTDAIADHFGGDPAFRLLLLPVEATLPVVERKEPAAEADADESAGKERAGARRISREELHEDVSQSARLTSIYVVMVVLSTLVACVGLLRGDVAIIIGAMVIAPLLGPNVALPLSIALGDGDLARRSLRAITVGVGTAAAVSLALGVVFEVDPSVSEIAQRTQPSVGDVVLALAAGAAGTLAFTSGVPAVVVGVMVAVALLPPLVVAGLLAGSGQGHAAVGALVLVVTNVTCVNLAAMATFVLQGVGPRAWWKASRARRHAVAAAIAWFVLLAVLVALIASGLVVPVDEVVGPSVASP